MVNFKKLTLVLIYVTMVAAIVTGVLFCNFCFKCRNTFWYVQLTDDIIYGLLIVILLVCVGLWVKEEVPRITLITFHLSAAILYFIVLIEVVFAWKYLKVAFQILLFLGPLLTGGLHLTLGLLYIYRDKIEAS